MYGTKERKIKRGISAVSQESHGICMERKVMRNKKLKQIWKRAVSVSLAAVMAFSLTARGKEEEKKEETPEYSYVPQYIELESGQSYWRSILMGNSFYSQVNNWDDATGTSSQKLMRYSIEEGKLGEGTAVLEITGGDDIQSFTVDKEGNFYLTKIKYPVLEEGEEYGEEYYENRQTFLSKYDPQGQQVYEQEITEQLKEDEEHNYVDTLLADDEGRIYVTTSDWIRLFDKDGKYAGKVSEEGSWYSGLGQGKDGKVYASYYDNNSEGNSYVLAEVDFAGKKLGKVYKNFIGGNNSGILTPGIEKDFLVQDGTNVYEYDLATETAEKLFNWLDCDINGNYIEKMGVTEDGRLIVIVNDWSTGEYDMALLEKKKTAELPVKETITIGALSESYDVKEAVVAFNKSNDKYRVRIKTYLDTNNWSQENYQNAITNLNNDIISGSNCPDILDLSSLNIRQLAAKGVFEDLAPYLDKSSSLSREDYLENILESLTINGKLVTIPYSFGIQTVLGKTEDVGDKMGWTLEEMIAFGEEHSGVQLFDYADKPTILTYCLSYNEAAFIDWETGECKFDSPEFKQLLEFVNKFPDEYDWESGGDKSTPEKLAAGEILLKPAYISSYDDMQYEIAQFNGEPVTCIGFPDVSGGSGCQMYVSKIYAISSQSQHKEGAWEFIESVLSKEPDDRSGDGFSTRKEVLAKQREEATKVTYVTDENGEPVLDEEGNPIEENGGGGGITIYGGSGGGWSYSYHRTTEEEADLVDALIAAAVPASMDSNSQVINIITEEADGYFKGQKSVDDVAGIIQSRIQLYVNENR